MEMNFSIKHMPAVANHYQYVIAKPCDKVGDFEFAGMTDDPQDAEAIVAKVKNGIVIHNTNAEGYEPPAVEKYYEFTGTWTTGVYATSKEQAIKAFHETYPEDYSFSDYEEIEEYDN